MYDVIHNELYAMIFESPFSLRVDSWIRFDLGSSSVPPRNCSASVDTKRIIASLLLYK